MPVAIERTEHPSREGVGMYMECLQYILYVALSTWRYVCVARTTGVGGQ